MTSDHPVFPLDILHLWPYLSFFISTSVGDRYVFVRLHCIVTIADTKP
jgi:hypothetical protein